MIEKDQGDFVGAGFKRLDAKLVTNNPPKIQWGNIYKDWPLKKRLKHAESLASSMNHAAAKIQEERDKLNELCVMKEAKLAEMIAAVKANNEMLQQEVTRMNEERQGYNKEIARLNAEIRAVKAGAGV